MKNQFIVLALTLMLTHNAFAQTVAWTDAYNGTIENKDRFVAAVVDGSGNTFATGYAFRTSNDRDVAVVKYSTAGAIVWQRTYTTPSDNTDEGNAIALDASGNVYVAGVADRNMLLLKLSAAGDTVWSRRYNGTGGGYDEAIALAIDGGGNIVITGKSDRDASTTLNYDYVTVKYNASGVQQWAQSYNGSGNTEDVPYDIAVDASSNVYVTGKASNIADFDIITLKYNASGVQQFAKLIDSGNGDEVANDIEVSGSNFYITGEYASTTTNDDYLTVKYDLAGNVVWNKIFDGGDDDRASEVKADASGNVYVSGRSEDANAIYNVVTIKYNAAGTQQWFNTYDNLGREDRPYDMVVDGSGNAYVAAESSIYSATDTIGDVITLKINAGGATQVWARVYADTGNGDDGGRAIGIDASGNVYTVGYGLTANQTDGLVIKYNATGTQQWLQHYNGQGDNTDKYRHLVIDAAGNMYTTGYGFNTEQGRNIITTKYNANGTFGWQQIYNSILNDNKNDEGNAIALDPAGNVYVTGVANSDLVVIKYNNAGVQQWVQSYNNVADDLDEGIACYADASGIYIAGRTDTDSSPNTNYDIIVTKLSSTGTQLWAQTYNGTANSNDRPEAMIGDANGIYITGRSTVGTTENIITLKYALNGTLGWTASYGTTTGNDRGDAIAVRGNAVYVGGRTNGGGTDDAVTIKYNGTGVQQWAQIYTNIGNDRIYDIATDSLGFVYVAGQDNDGTDDNVLVIKYNNAGVQQWLSTYDSGTGYDQANALAVDCAGNVWITGRKQDAALADDLLTIKYNGKTGAQMWLDTYTGSNLDDVGNDIAIYGSGTNNSIYVVGSTETASTQEDALARKYTETIPVLTISPANPTICLGQSVTLSVSGATLGAFKWKDGATVLSTDTLVTVTPTTAGIKIYTLQWNSGTCSATINVPVTVQNAVVPTITGNASVCTANTYTYAVQTPISGTTYTWTVGAGGTIVGSNIGTAITVQWTSGTTSTVSVVGN